MWGAIAILPAIRGKRATISVDKEKWYTFFCVTDYHVCTSLKKQCNYGVVESVASYPASVIGCMKSLFDQHSPLYTFPRFVSAFGAGHEVKFHLRGVRWMLFYVRVE